MRDKTDKKKQVEKSQKQAQNRKINDAYEEASLIQSQSLQAAGLPMEKYWSTIGDDKVCDVCRENEGAGWIPLDDAFPGGHMRPLAHDGCRCGMLTQMIRERG